MKKFHLWEVYGVELEYMIVHRDSLEIAPVADRVFYRRNGTWDGEAENGTISWSNELVSHVIELKTSKPSTNLTGLSRQFQENITEINLILNEENCILLPTASHPWMDPMLETRIWPHDQHEIYELYNRIFDCRGHGWGNVQSTHLNLPFSGTEEFSRLHTAIRLLLPAIPALCASSPILEGQSTDYLDSRMYHYQRNQQAIPVITGRVIPEYIRNQTEYQQQIFDPINAALRPYDTDQILDQHFVNSRGAIARFDRGAIEIRVMDIQECPMADLGIIEFVVEILKSLVSEEWVTFRKQSGWHEDRLYPILQNAIKNGGQGKIEDEAYAVSFGIDPDSCRTFRDLWMLLYNKVGHRLSDECRIVIDHLLNSGTLAERILQSVQGDFSHDHLRSVYHDLAQCLANGHLYKVPTSSLLTI